jgi:hypothetical protein
MPAWSCGQAKQAQYWRQQGVPVTNHMLKSAKDCDGTSSKRSSGVAQNKLGLHSYRFFVLHGQYLSIAESQHHANEKLNNKKYTTHKKKKRNHAVKIFQLSSQHARSKITLVT